MEAQGQWVAEIDAASKKPDLMKDESWRSRSVALLDQVVAAAGGLQVEPVPDSMAAVDRTLAEARKEAHLAGESYSAAAGDGNLGSIVSTLQHIDRMSQLIQQARAQVRS